jgi:hypothetical protein
VSAVSSPRAPDKFSAKSFLRNTHTCPERPVVSEVEPSQGDASRNTKLMLEVSFAGKDHRDAVFATVVNKNYFAVLGVS